MTRRALLPFALLFLIIAFGIALTGGFATTVWGWRVSARSSGTALLVALVTLATWFIIAQRRRAARADVEWTWEWVDHNGGIIAAWVAVVAGAVAVRFGTFSAAGSDASGYLSQAAMLWSGQLSHSEALTPLAGWPGAAATLVPLGWRPALEVGSQVPTYAPGLPLLLAIPQGIGGSVGTGAAVACAVALAVWSCARLARELWSPAAGIVAAVWLATSPTFLVQSFQPMSDVPVTAAWLLCWALLGRRHAAAAGTCAALAILIRPNLAPLAAVPALHLLFASPGTGEIGSGTSGGTSGILGTRSRLSQATAFSIPVAVAGAAVAWFQWLWYGSALLSGYGRPGELYSLAHLSPNLSRYFEWLLAIESPILLLAPLALFRPFPRIARWALAFAGLLVLSYALYLVVEQWTYLRFLLPAIGIAIAAVSGGAVAVITRLPVICRGPLLATAVLALAANGVVKARAVGAFEVAGVQRRSVLAGRYLAPLTMPTAVIIAGEQSGAMRYYTGRSIVRWDLLEPDALNSVLDALVRAGREPWIVLDEWEEEPFRARFAQTIDGALDWPPIVDAGREARTRAWRVGDRQRFMRGERLWTDRLR